MNRRAAWLVGLVLAAGSAGCGEGPGVSGPLALVGARVLPMDQERVLDDHTVVVGAGRILALGPRERTPIPWNARRIDARGAVVMPGLVDMHVHLNGIRSLGAHLARGVTTVRNMRGRPLHLDWRARIERGEMLGPTLYTAGPSLDGDPPVVAGSAVVATPREARRAVLAQAAAGYDFVKVYNRLSPEAYAAVIETARAVGLPVAGHVPRRVGLAAALAAGQDSIEHVEEWSRHHDFDAGPDEIATVAARARRHEVWICPTLALHRFFGASPALDFHERLVRGLRDAGVGVLLGTDGGAEFVPREVAALREAGLAPFEVLAAGTRDAARFLGAEAEFGTLAVGRRADLVVLDGDPLADPTALERVVGVVARGRWLGPERLARLRGP